MEWLPLVVIGILIVILGLYFIVKWAVKDALKEYFNDKENNKSYLSFWQAIEKLNTSRPPAAPPSRKSFEVSCFSFIQNRREDRQPCQPRLNYMRRWRRRWRSSSPAAGRNGRAF